MSEAMQPMSAAPATPESPAAATVPDVTVVRAVVEEHFLGLLFPAFEAQ